MLALCTATRHPFIAMVLIQANFASEQLAVPAVFMALIVTSIASLPYVRMLRRQPVGAASEAVPVPAPEAPSVKQPPARRSA